MLEDTEVVQLKANLQESISVGLCTDLRVHESLESDSLVFEFWTALQQLKT